MISCIVAGGGGGGGGGGGVEAQYRGMGALASLLYSWDRGLWMDGRDLCGDWYGRMDLEGVSAT